MYVCHCAVVTDGDVLESIANGARCVADVARQTGAGRTCGNCVSSLRDLVCQHCPVRAERTTECDAGIESGPAADRELGVAGAAR
jgi:bacterioferritin-associated ferredoxin